MPTKKNKAKKTGSGRQPTQKKFESTSTRAGLSMPVPRIRRNIKAGKYASKMTKTAPIYLTSVIEYLVAEVLELAGNAAKDNKKKTIAPRHVMIAIKTDDELGRLCKDVTFPHSGTLMNIHPSLLKNIKKKKKKKKAQSSDEEESIYSQHF